jgi:hypothetical protein
MDPYKDTDVEIMDSDSDTLIVQLYVTINAYTHECGESGNEANEHGSE